VAGLGVNALGHAHPRIVKATREQAARVIHISNLYYNEYQGQLAERLCQLSGSNFDRRFLFELWNRGMEAPSSWRVSLDIKAAAMPSRNWWRCRVRITGGRLAPCPLTGQESIAKVLSRCSKT